MAAKRKNSSLLSSQKSKNSPRLSPTTLRRIIGCSMCLSGIFIGIASISYLFTWDTDQDQVLFFQWSILFENQQMANWMGRLGAILSHQVFYWTFGLPSFILISLWTITGWYIFRFLPAKPLFQYARHWIPVMLFFSIYLEFVFPSSSFPWGGAFGNQVNNYMTNFLGVPGMVILLVAILLYAVVKVYKVNTEEFRMLWPNMAAFKEKVKQATTPDPAYVDAEPVAKKKEYVPVTHSPQSQANLEVPLEKIDKPKPTPPAPAKPELPVKSAFSELELTQESQKPVELLSPEELEALTAKSIIEENETEEIFVEETEDEKNGIVHGDHIGLASQYDPRLALHAYVSPGVELLVDYHDPSILIDKSELEANSRLIQETLSHYKIGIKKMQATVGPTVTLYELVPDDGVRINRIKSLENDIALSLAALGIRIIAPIPGKGTIGIEVPNKKRQKVGLREIIASDHFRNTKMELPIALGKTISNEIFVADLERMPHLLIAGATGQGKSVGINAILMSLVYKKHPSELKLVLIDPKKVELYPYNKLKDHFLSFLPGESEPIVTDTEKVIITLNSLCVEMETRYELLKKAHVRKIREYNDKFLARRLNPEKGHKFLPYIVLVIDEFADLIMTAGRDIEHPIGRLSQLARAVGIHLIIATQRPSVNIITGVIKANFPARIAFKVAQRVDSRTILDQMGAEQLVGNGDMLLSVDGEIVRLQCAFVDTHEVEKVIHHIAYQDGFPEPFYLPEYKAESSGGGDSGSSLDDADDMLYDAAQLVVTQQIGSTSMIQRRMKLGYNRAGRIMDQLHSLGVVGPAEGSKPRQVYCQTTQELDKIFFGGHSDN